MSVPEIVAWQALLTDHQSHTFDALAAATGRRMRLKVGRTDDDIRRAQGWTFAAPKLLDIEPRDGGEAFQRDVVHLFGSPFEDVRQIMALAGIVLRHQCAFLIAEPHAPPQTSYFRQPGWRDRLRDVLRPAAYKAYALLLARRISGVFAISPRAVAQFRSMGVPPDCIFPFGYFVPSVGARRLPHRQPGAPLRVVFIGALIERKGLLELAAAARRLHDARCPIVIDVYGPGDPARFDLAGARVNYRGPAAFGTAQVIFASYDLAVVPSRHDGWGVVVNEALLAGTPVLCSAGVGASALIVKSGGGQVVAANDSDALADALTNLASDAAKLDVMAAAASRFAPYLTPDVAGRYLLAAIASRLDGTSPPACPWYDMP